MKRAVGGGACLGASGSGVKGVLQEAVALGDEAAEEWRAGVGQKGGGGGAENAPEGALILERAVEGQEQKGEYGEEEDEEEG
jgi:hypothetical protein